jgi:hypothetical protein
MRHAPRSATAAAAAIAAATLCGGCIFVSDTERVYTADPITHDEMTGMIARTRDLHVGMARQDALALYAIEHLNLKSSTMSDGLVYEEWQVEASSRRGDQHFRRYLYFADGRLAAFSDERIHYRENAELLRNWAGR